MGVGTDAVVTTVEVTKLGSHNIRFHCLSRLLPVDKCKRTGEWEIYVHVNYPGGPRSATCVELLHGNGIFLSSFEHMF